jgi:hypothetical protein
MEENKQNRLMEFLNDAKVVVYFMAGIIGFFVWINVQLVGIQKDINIIQNNHLAHIQTALDQHNKQFEDVQETIVQILIELERHDTQLNP